MGFKIDYSRDACKFLETLPAKQFKQVANKILKLVQNPLPSDAIKLKGDKERFRTDIGEYRIVYSSHHSDNVIEIIVVGKRNDGEIYKKANRKK